MPGGGAQYLIDTILELFFRIANLFVNACEDSIVENIRIASA